MTAGLFVQLRGHFNDRQIARRDLLSLAVTALWASGGLQAPRIRSGGASTPSLAFMVAPTTIYFHMT